MKIIAVLSSILALTNAMFVEQEAPLVTGAGAKVITGKYLVELKNNVGAFHADHVEWINVELQNHPESQIDHHFNFEEIRGYSGTFSDDLLKKIRQNPNVERVERDQEVSIERMSENYVEAKLEIVNDAAGAKAAFSPAHDAASTIQRNAPWGLARISSVKLPSPLNTYTYPSTAGAGSTVYVVDTGVYVGHNDFGGRASWGASFIDGEADTDGNGHGTHCAGTIAGKTYGVAKQAKIVAVKVLSARGSGSMSGVIKGVEFVVKSHKASGGKKSIASMSLGGGKSLILEKAIAAAVSAGVHFAVAAGNENQNACNVSPAGSPAPLTVGATNNQDGRAWFSNWGTCVDLFGPGVNVLSAWIGNPNAVNTISGTSMATPHVAGVLALFVATGKYSSVKEAQDAVVAAGSKGLINDVRGSPNILLNINELL